MQNQNLFPLNSSLLDPVIKGGIPLAFELHENVNFGANSAGVKTKELVSAFGTGKGEVLGVISLKTREAANTALVYVVAASSTTGQVLLTQNSTNASSSVDVTNSFLLMGRIFPSAVE
jgi:hypothetical protein